MARKSSTGKMWEFTNFVNGFAVNEELMRKMMKAVDAPEAWIGTAPTGPTPTECNSAAVLEEFEAEQKLVQ